MKMSEVTVTYVGRDIHRTLLNYRILAIRKNALATEHPKSSYSKQCRREIKKLQDRLIFLASK